MKEQSKMKIRMSWFLLLNTIVIVVVIRALSNTKRFYSASHSTLSHRLLLQSSSPSSSSFANSIAKLTADNGEIGDNFGYTVAISNNRIVVGAFGHNNYTGAAYLFGDPTHPQSGRSYSQLAILTASDGRSGDQFGGAVAMDGDILVIGASAYMGKGAVSVIQIIQNSNNNTITISAVAKLTASVSDGLIGDSFGSPVAIHGNYILVGASFTDTIDSFDVGAAYLFVNPLNDRHTPGWTQLQKYQPEDLKTNDWFGGSVAINDNIAIVGAFDEFFDSNPNAAYVFAPINKDESVNSSSSSLLSSWTQIAKLTGSM
jgi:hypothetical protein